MAAQNIVFKDGNINDGEGNKSSHTETTNSTPLFTRVIRDVVSLCKLRRIVVAFLLALFPFPVEDEFHSDLAIILIALNRNSQRKIYPCESRCLLLKFSHEIAPLLVFTGDCIFPKGTKLELVDTVTGQHVRHGPLASGEVEFFLLNGNTGGDDGETWTTEEMKSHLIMQKRGGKSRCNKNPYLRLEGGVVSVDEIKFEHRQKHMKKLELVRLGARVQPEEIQVKEAVTGPFTLKDQRLKSKKRYPPSPTDDVWRLEQISIKGAFGSRLTENGIKTVEDFLIELHNNPQRLRHVIRLGSGCGFHQFNILSESQKAYAHKLVETAFANWENVLKFDSEISITDHLSSSTVSPPSCPAPDDLHTEFQLISKAAGSECPTYNGIADWLSGSNEMSLAITSPGTWGYLGSPNNITSMNLDSGDWEEIIHLLNSDERQFEDSPHGEPGQSYYSAAETSAMQFHGLQHDERMDLSQNQFTHLMISEDVHTNADQWHQMNDVSMVQVASMRKGKSKKRWAKISSILRWFSVKRFVELKKVRITKKRKFSRLCSI
ncbi:hypothetical protein K7X08_024494 [Anisodus acutangulus]|uniref:Uncharacterized protein n=1 Tax=Anisodus acutangulus TaxID=402998 RepID=A0A9Q1M8H3_9SOLA|nr:hypothetical protein K7X08_024494 [Anisodus acutangulus]